MEKKRDFIVKKVWKETLLLKQNYLSFLKIVNKNLFSKINLFLNQ